MRRSPYCARSCFVPFWPGLRCSRTREVEDLGERRGGVARAEGPVGAIDGGAVRGPAGLGSWTANAEPHQRPSDTTTHESGSLLRTLVIAAARPLSANRVDDESASRNVPTPIRRAGRRTLCVRRGWKPSPARRGYVGSRPQHRLSALTCAARLRSVLLSRRGDLFCSNNCSVFCTS